MSYHNIRDHDNTLLLCSFSKDFYRSMGVVENINDTFKNYIFNAYHEAKYYLGLALGIKSQEDQSFEDFEQLDFHDYNALAIKLFDLYVCSIDNSLQALTLASVIISEETKAIILDLTTLQEANGSEDEYIYIDTRYSNFVNAIYLTSKANLKTICDTIYSYALHNNIFRAHVRNMLSLKSMPQTELLDSDVAAIEIYACKLLKILSDKVLEPPQICSNHTPEQLDQYLFSNGIYDFLSKKRKPTPIELVMVLLTVTHLAAKIHLDDAQENVQRILEKMSILTHCSNIHSLASKLRWCESYIFSNIFCNNISKNQEQTVESIRTKYNKKLRIYTS